MTHDKHPPRDENYLHPEEDENRRLRLVTDCAEKSVSGDPLELPPLEAALIVSDNLSVGRPWEIEQRRLDLAGYLAQAQREADQLHHGYTVEADRRARAEECESELREENLRLWEVIAQCEAEIERLRFEVAALEGDNQEMRENDEHPNE